MKVRLLLLCICLSYFTRILYSQSSVNYAARFNGLDTYISLPCYFGNVSEITIECWYKTESNGTGALQALVSSDAHKFIHLQVGTSGAIRAYQNIGWSDFSIAPEVPYNSWQHIALSIKPNEQKLYLNGNLVSWRSDPFSVITRYRNVNIGAGFDGRFFKGWIDEVRVWYKMRSQQEIQSTMFTEIPGDTVGLYAYYKMNKDSNSEKGIVTDFGPNKLHGRWIECGGLNDTVVLDASNIFAFTVLPIELVDFTATPDSKEIDLSWWTVSEINNDYFTVERRGDNIDWEEIISVTGAGNSNKLIEYNRSDRNPLIGNNYYRLKQTDFDGTESHSDPVVAFFEQDRKYKMLFRIYPNPTSNTLTIEGMNSYSKSSTFPINISNSIGNTIINDFISEGLKRLDMDGLPGGGYVLQIGENNSNSFRKVFIINK